MTEIPLRRKPCPFCGDITNNKWDKLRITLQKEIKNVKGKPTHDAIDRGLVYHEINILNWVLKKMEE
jgi:hypothetical protein